MSPFMRSTGQAGVLSVVEGALIANGYTRDGSPRAQGSATAVVIWQCGTTAVLLAQRPNNAVAEIEVWGAGQSATTDVFESLPIELHKQPPLRSALRSP